MKERIKTYRLPVRRSLMNKAVCLQEARRIRLENHIEHMSEQAIAEELFFHAVVWYFCKRLEQFHIKLPIIKAHADPIDLSDFGDTRFRRFCFRIAWFLPGSKDSDN